MESNGPLVESDENPFEALDDSDDEDDVEDIVTENETNGTRVHCRPSQYSPDFGSQRYDDTSDQIHIQVDDVTKFKLPKVRKCEKFDHVVHSVMMQLSLKKGLKEFGKEGEEAAIKEMQQHHDMETFRPRYALELTGDKRREPLSSLMHLKKKRNGKIKGRSCADGRPQRKVVTKDEVASPTVATESIFTTATIDAFENRDVTTVDLPGVFLHTEVDPNGDIVHMVLRGKLAELMVKINPSMYQKYVTSDKNRHTLLYVELQKAVYGTLKALLLFYQKLVKHRR